MYGETFYGRHTAQHQLQWTFLKMTKLMFTITVKSKSYSEMTKLISS